VCVSACMCVYVCLRTRTHTLSSSFPFHLLFSSHCSTLISSSLSWFGTDGTSAGVRRAAAIQIGDVQKAHPMQLPALVRERGI
jgi:hypothetical protein